jgi:hypothetical protein
MGPAAQPEDHGSDFSLDVQCQSARSASLVLPKTKRRSRARRRASSNGIRTFAVGYPDAWKSSISPWEYPLGRLVLAFAKAIRGDAVAARAARLRGAELRLAHGYATPADAEDVAADLFRGLACIAAEVLHGPVCTEFGGGDRLTAEQVAFLVADD